MGVDVIIRIDKPEYCPHCGKIANWDHIYAACSDGKDWYSFLETIGYYPSADTDERYKWYGKDMVLDDKQIKFLAAFVQDKKPTYCADILRIVGMHEAIENSRVVIKADW